MNSWFIMIMMANRSTEQYMEKRLEAEVEIALRKNRYGLVEVIEVSPMLH